VEEGGEEEEEVEEEGKDHRPHRHLDHLPQGLGMVRHLWVDLDLDRGMDLLHLWEVHHLLLEDGWTLGCYPLELICLGVRKLWIRLQRPWRKFLPVNYRMLWLE
jgi:hypothetical protein